MNCRYYQVRNIIHYLFAGVTKVESLSNGKSLESVKSISSDEPDADFESEKWHSITLQVFVPFMLAGIGTIGAGIVLGNVQVS